LCLGCQAKGRVEPATVVDHIEPHKLDQTKFWDESNWQSCCDWHHNAVKAKLEAMWMDGVIKVVDLRLDSAAAVKLARQTPRRARTSGPTAGRSVDRGGG
jgi:5-methylcytosine-specific restriction protein A